MNPLIIALFFKKCEEIYTVEYSGHEPVHEWYITDKILMDTHQMFHPKPMTYWRLNH
jgi:hypothetical protein